MRALTATYDDPAIEHDFAAIIRGCCKFGTHEFVGVGDAQRTATFFWLCLAAVDSFGSMADDLGEPAPVSIVAATVRLRTRAKSRSANLLCLAAGYASVPSLTRPGPNGAKYREGKLSFSFVFFLFFVVWAVVGICQVVAWVDTCHSPFGHTVFVWVRGAGFPAVVVVAFFVDMGAVCIQPETAKP